MAKRQFCTPESVKVGDIVFYKGAGKMARCEGMAGKIVQATVERVCCDRESLDVYGEAMLSVMPDHRTLTGADFHNLGSLVPVSKCWKE